MMPLVPLLILPLAIIISLLLNAYGNWSFTALEQTRLDALTLSLCHHRKNFINENIQKQNKRIRALQNTMDAAVLSCLGASVVGRFEFCLAIQKILKAESKAGKFIEGIQNIRRRAYPLEQIELIQRLSRENELSIQFGRLIIDKANLFINDGFKREKLGSKHQIWGKLFRVKWPQTLIEADQFARYHEFKSRFRPQRTLISVSPESNKWRGLKSFKHQAKKGSHATTTSACRVEKGTYRVKRLQ